MIASQYTFEWRRKLKDDSGERLRLAKEEFEEYEQARAQRIVDNPGFDVDAPEVPKEEEEKVDVTTDTPTADDDSRDVLSKDDIARSYAMDTELEQPEVQTDEQDTQVDSKKKTPSDLVTLDTLSDKEVISDELKTQRTKELEDQEADEEWQTAKQVWKEQHPNLTLKTFKQLYIEGKIDQLPWEDYKPKKFIAKEGNVQVSKETTDENEGYIQNAEQTDESIWKNIQNKKPE